MNNKVVLNDMYEHDHTILSGKEVDTKHYLKNNYCFIFKMYINP